MRAIWVVVTAFVLLVIAFFVRWRPAAADDRAMAAERQRIRRLMAQGRAEKGNEHNKNES